MNPQGGWSGKELALVGIGIVVVVMLWDSSPVFGWLILAAILIVLGNARRQGTVQFPT